MLAIGSPFQLNSTVTLGIISAVGRTNVGVSEYEDFIQTDAAINPGNSGGAMIDARGELVGINTAILSRTGGYQGIGFAVPSNLAKRVIDDLIRYGQVQRGSIGALQVDSLTTSVAEYLRVSDTRGAWCGGSPGRALPTRPAFGRSTSSSPSTASPWTIRRRWCAWCPTRRLDRPRRSS